eukprot:jgi/Hompol1/6615/HPOL_000965-RA
MTIAMMKSFGIHVEREAGTNIYRIPTGIYVNPAEYIIEADASSATYPLAYAAITGSRVTVTNIGSNSLQGDAEFAIKVLRPMGCDVIQTETSTTVQGPKQLLPLPSIDMESMTDAFMTAAVLAAVAQGGDHNADKHVTRIVGIANQRVKECDRIAAMVEQLARFGITASELPDGIQIHGINKTELSHRDADRGVKCYDDHRIAMSFSILASVMPAAQPRVVITEKKCVEKTWPSWWDTIENVLGVHLTGIDIDPPHSETLVNDHDDATSVPSSVVSTDIQLQSKSIVIVGMRGAGKTHMGRAAARSLGRKFIDMDVYFEQTLAITIPEFIKTKGWEEFRRTETELLGRVFSEHPTGAVIATGGGIVETEAARVAIKQWSGLTIHVRRNIDDVEAYLGIDKTRPSFGENIRDVFERRKPWYNECSQAEFVIPSALDVSNASLAIHWTTVEQSFVRFLKHKLRRSPMSVSSSASSLSFFVSLTYPNVADAASFIEKITEGANAIELRVDLLASTDHEYVGKQVALLRHLSSLPIVYTVRTKSQGGQFPDDRKAEMIELLHHGLRWGCEFVDVEFTHPLSRFKSLIEAKGNTLIIGSYHDCKGTALWTDKIQGQSGIGGKSAASLGNVQPVRMRQVYQDLHTHSDIIKLIGVAHSLSDNFAVDEFTRLIVPGLNLPPKPLITMLMGPLGQLSRALNTFMTPVTHAAIPTPAAPGQLSIAQIHAIRHSIGLLPARKFYLFGSPISASMSPTLHNTGFKQLGLPHHYQLFETEAWEAVKQVVDSGVANGTFGGASVTIPLKIDVLRHGIAKKITPAAQQIGAVNTLFIDSDGAIAADNTDWIGIRRCAERHLASLSISDSTPIIGVVLGAGGTARAACFALKRIAGVQSVRVWNRTASKATEIASEFGCDAVESLDSLLLHHVPAVFVVVGTIPASAQEQLDLNAMFGAAGQSLGGVVVEMAYRPRQTKLLDAALGSANSTDAIWKVAQGIDALIEQGLEQFEIWTGRHPPAAAMSEAVYAAYH